MTESMELKFPTFRRLWRPWRTTQLQRLALLRLIAVATEEQLPLAPLLDAWALDERGNQQTRVRRLAKLLHNGAPLATAVEEVPGALREEDVLAIRFGVQSGTLAASLRQSLNASTRSLTSRREIRGAIFYGGVVAVMASLIVAFNQIKIIPAIRAILHDYSMEAPEPLQWSVWIGDVATRYWWAGAIGLLALAWSAFSAWPGRFLRHTIAGRLFLPLRELRSAEVLQKLSVAAQAGRPMPGALSTLARYHFDPRVRHKLLFVRNELEQGADVWRSMTAAGLLTPPEERLINSADVLGNRSWALKQLAAGKERRTLRLLDRFSALAIPAVVLLLGAFVLLQGLSIFVPLVTLVMGVL